MSDTATTITVLQALRFKGAGNEEHLAQATHLPAGRLREQLGALGAAGLVDGDDGRWRISAAGVERLESLLAAEREELDRWLLGALYARFEPINAKLKQIVTAWQVRPGPQGEVPNDHSDPDYDAGVRERLAKLDDRFAPLLDEMVALVPRWACYRERLETAVAALDGGDDRYLLSPLLDSYHTVWFELHEELIGAAGLDRVVEESQEGAPASSV